MSFCIRRLCLLLLTTVAAAATIASAVAAQQRELFTPPENSQTLAVVDLGTSSEPVTFDLGLLKYQNKVVYQIPLENSTSQDLELKSAKVSCGCMVAAPASTTFPAKSNTNIFLTLNPDKLGDVKRRLTLVFDEDEPPFHIDLKAKVARPFSVDPEILYVASEETDTKVFVSQNFPTEASGLKSVSVLSDLVSVSGEFRQLSPREASVDLNLKEFFLTNERQLPVVICLASGDGATHEHRLMIRRRDIVQIHPNTLVERDRGGRKRASAYISGEPELINLLMVQDNLKCVVREQQAEVEIKSKRLVGDHMLIAELEIVGNSSGEKTVEVIWVKNPGEVELGKSTVLLAKY